MSQNILPNIEVKIEGKDRKTLKAVVKNSDQIGRVTLGKNLGKKRLLILVIEYEDPRDRPFIDIGKGPEIPADSVIETKNSTATQLDPLAVSAMKFILQEFSNKRRPSMKEVADHLEIGTRELGRLLRPHGIVASSTSRDWKPMRLYQPSLKGRIEMLLENTSNDS